MSQFSNDEFRHVFENQLRHFDQEMTELRRVFDSLDLDERKDLREWLEAVDCVERKCPFDWSLRVTVQHDEFDERDEKVGECNAQFAAMTMLAAIKCWDDGKPFAPDTIYP